jgi:hypothetical protein
MRYWQNKFKFDDNNCLEYYYYYKAEKLCYDEKSTLILDSKIHPLENTNTQAIHQFHVPHI